MRTPHVIALVLVLLALAGCKVIVLGDSNSCMGLLHECTPDSWAAILQRRLDRESSLWLVENRGMPGMTAGRFYDTNGHESRFELWHEPAAASFHLERLLREDDLASLCRWVPFGALAPRLVIALGTNDFSKHPGYEAADDIMALQKQALEAAPCLRVYVATVPPRFDGARARDAERLVTNALLRSRVAPDRLLDFDTAVTRDDFGPDGVHVNPAGHAKRAAEALRVLFPGLVEPGPTEITHGGRGRRGGPARSPACGRRCRRGR